MPTPLEVAQFMMQQFEAVPERGRMHQSSIARRIRVEFGEDFTYKNKNRNWAIKKEVLDEFRQLNDDDVVWEQGRQAWRRRRETDKPWPKAKVKSRVLQEIHDGSGKVREELCPRERAVAPAKA